MIGLSPLLRERWRRSLGGRRLRSAGTTHLPVRNDPRLKGVADALPVAIDDVSAKPKPFGRCDSDGTEAHQPRSGAKVPHERHRPALAPERPQRVLLDKVESADIDAATPSTILVPDARRAHHRRVSALRHEASAEKDEVLDGTLVLGTLDAELAREMKFVGAGHRRVAEQGARPVTHRVDARRRQPHWWPCGRWGGDAEELGEMVVEVRGHGDVSTVTVAPTPSACSFASSLAPTRENPSLFHTGSERDIQTGSPNGL